MNAVEKGMMLGILINHQVKVLPAFWVFHVEPNFLVGISPVVKASLLYIVPDLFQLFICEDFTVPNIKNLV
jgi:hypothetical protein